MGQLWVTTLVSYFPKVDFEFQRAQMLCPCAYRFLPGQQGGLSSWHAGLRLSRAAGCSGERGLQEESFCGWGAGFSIQAGHMQSGPAWTGAELLEATAVKIKSLWCGRISGSPEGKQVSLLHCCEPDPVEGMRLSLLQALSQLTSYQTPGSCLWTSLKYLFSGWKVIYKSGVGRLPKSTDVPGLKYEKARWLHRRQKISTAVLHIRTVKSRDWEKAA